MRIDPYRRRPPEQHVGLVRHDRRVLLEDGRRPRLDQVPAGTKLYADAHVVNTYFLRRGDGQAVSWNDRPVRWMPKDSEHSVYLLQGYPGDGPDVLEGLVAWRDRLNSHGARVGSPAGASLSLLKTTLSAPLFLGTNRPRLGLVLGGRQEAFAEPGVFGPFAHLDLSAAYARTLGELRYPAGPWLDLGRPGRIVDEPDGPMLVRARVRIPPGAVGPLPRRLRSKPEPGIARLLTPVEYPTGTTMQGIYNLLELRAAEAAGAEVRALRAWINVGAWDYPFALWWELIQSGRRLPGYAGALFKQMGNTLWGRFAIEGRRTLDRWTRDGRRISKPLTDGHLNPAYNAEDLSELVSSAVRARLLTELIRPAGGALLSVHTDGGLVRLDGVPRIAPEWRVKFTGSVLIYLGPQMYAYRPPRARTLTYVVSGLPPDAVPSVFAGLCAQSIGWPPTTYGDTVEARERRALERLARELDAAELVVPEGLAV